jgi:hypothetical protein
MGIEGTVAVVAGSIALVGFGPDSAIELLSFLLVCCVCGTEKLVHRQPYEPRFEPHPAPRFRGGAIGLAGQQQPDASDQAGTR